MEDLQMKSAIDRLEEKVWASCITQRAAQDQQTIERWQRDHYAHLKERFIVSPIPATLNQLVEAALEEWQQRENRLFSSLGMSREQFLDKFEKTRTSFLQGKNAWQGFVYQTGEAVYAVVKNMDWVNLFSWILPVANTEIADRLYITGRTVATIFYIETLWKNLDARPENFKNIEACWKLASRV
jgi:hypothetical protein